MQHLHDQIQDFNPRSPWGERHLIAAGVGGAIVFQSTLPVGGSDLTWAMVNAVLFIFQSTLPAGGATLTESKNLNAQTQFQSTLPAKGATLHGQW